MDEIVMPSERKPAVSENIPESMDEQESPEKGTEKPFVPSVQKAAGQEVKEAGPRLKNQAESKKKLGSCYVFCWC